MADDTSRLPQMADCLFIFSTVERNSARRGAKPIRGCIKKIKYLQSESVKGEMKIRAFSLLMLKVLKIPLMRSIKVTMLVKKCPVSSDILA